MGLLILTREVKLSFCLLILLLAGCGVRVADRVRPGVTTVEEIQKTLGAPNRVVKPPTAPEAEVLGYKADPDCTYQQENQVVVQVACSPKPLERDLQYWLHRWAGHRVERRVTTTGRHGAQEQSIHNPKAKQIVFYNSSGIVQKVVRYGRP